MEAAIATLTGIVEASFLAFLVVVAYQLLTGRIATEGLLSTGEGGTADPERVLLLAATAAGAFSYLSLALGADPGAPALRLPEAPEWLVASVGAGNLFYLTGKTLR